MAELSIVLTLALLCVAAAITAHIYADNSESHRAWPWLTGISAFAGSAACILLRLRCAGIVNSAVVPLVF